MVEDWFQKNKLFFRKVGAEKVMREVHEQAARHMDRLDRNSIIKEYRPNESDEVNEYRNKNKRDITRGDVRKWLVKISRIIRGNVFDSFVGSDDLTDYQYEKSYEIFGQGVTYFDWIMNYVFPACIKDPNLIKVNLPFLEDEPLTAPAVGLNQTDGHVPFKELIIHFDDVFEREKVLAFRWGMKKVMIAGSPTDQPIYWLADQEWWYILEPYYNDAESNVDWELKKWYFHDSEQLPFTNGMGIYQEKEEFGHKDRYKESILLPYFEYADEFVAFFSDNQAIAAVHAHPKLIMYQLPCPTCSKGGVATGKISTNENGEKVLKSCPTCAGTKIIQSPSPYSTLFVPTPEIGDNAIAPKDMVHALTYGESLFKTRYDIGWDLLNKGKKQIGLDLLVDMNESGVAMQYRLDDLQDFIGSIASLIHGFIVNDLWLKECLLQPNKDRRESVIFTVPKTFYLKDDKEVLKDIRDLPITERQERMIDYYSKKYQGDPIAAKAYEMSIIYAPVQLYSDQEIKEYASAGFFSKEQVVKGMYATWAMKQIGERILIMDLRSIFDAADVIIEPLIDTMPINVLTQ